MIAPNRLGNVLPALLLVPCLGCQDEAAARLPRVHEWAGSATNKLMSRDYKAALQLLVQVPPAEREGIWWQLLEASAIDCYARDKDQWCVDRFTDAVRDCEKREPKDSSCLFWTGVGFDELGNHAEAQRRFDDAGRAARRDLEANSDRETVSAAKMVLQNLESRMTPGRSARTP